MLAPPRITFNNGALRAAREAAGLSRTTLAYCVGVAHHSIVRWELGTTEPSASNAARAAAVLGVPLSHLFTTDPER